MVAIWPAARKVNRFIRLAGSSLAIRGLGFLIGLVFIYAGQAKIRTAAVFADSIASFRLVPDIFNNAVALGLPPFEVLLGVLLIIGWRRRTMAFCALMVSGIFLLALVSAEARGITVECGCFGAASAVSSSELSLWLSVGRDLLLLMATIVLYVDAVGNDLKPTSWKSV